MEEIRPVLTGNYEFEHRNLKENYIFEPLRTNWFSTQPIKT